MNASPVPSCRRLKIPLISGGAVAVVLAASFFFPALRSGAEWGGVGGLAGPGTTPDPVPVPGDADGDGMPDAWESANLLNPANPADAASDFDRDGLTALQEYGLNLATAGVYGKHLGTWSASLLPRPTGFIGTPSVTIIEYAPNGVILARVQGRLTDSTVTTTYPYTWSPATEAWTRIQAPPGFEAVTSLTPLDVNASGQVVGYFSSGGTKGFLWTPAGSGGQSVVYQLDTGGPPADAIPKRISDSGYVVGNVGSLSGRSFAGTDSGDEITFPGLWTPPVFHDVNDYGEFVGTVYDPLAARNVTFLAMPGFPVFSTGISAEVCEDMAGIWGEIPDIDPAEIVWEPDPSGYGSFREGTAIDHRTGNLVDVHEGYGASFYWYHATAYYGGAWYAYPGFSQNFAAVNDWGEFAGLYSATMSSMTFYGGYQSSRPSLYNNGIFFFEGDYHVSNARPSIYGVSNDPSVLIGTPYALWSGSLVVPVTSLMPAGSPATFAFGRLADGGRVILQQSTSAQIHLLKPDQDSDGDGMPNDWEVFYGLNPADAQDASADANQNGTSNRAEFGLRANPLAAPGAGGSVQFIDLRPGIDTDGDGMPNTWEWKHGLNYSDASDALADYDGDGLTNLKEFLLGTAPRAADVDDDGFSDGEEIAQGTDPKLTDSDGDGEPDGNDSDTYRNDPVSATPPQAASPGSPPEPLYLNFVSKSYSEDDSSQTITHAAPQEPEQWNYGNKVTEKRTLSRIVDVRSNHYDGGIDSSEETVLQGCKRAAFPHFEEISEAMRDFARAENGWTHPARCAFEESFQTDSVGWSSFESGGFAESVLVRLERRKTEPTERSFSYLKLFKEQDEEVTTEYRIVSVEPLTLTIPANEARSNVAKLEVDAAGISCSLIPVEHSLYPDAETSNSAVEISADDAKQELAAVILVPDMSPDAEPGALIEAEDGTVIEWELIEGNGSISTQQTTTTNGVAVTTLTTTTTPGDTYRAKAKVRTLKWNGGSYDLGVTGLVTESAPLQVVPGKAATIEATKSKDEYSSDATDEVEIEITIKDQHANLLKDGTPVTWILDKSTGGFAKDGQEEEMVEFELTDGKAKASLRAPTMPVDQNLIVIVDGLTEVIPMTVNRVTGSISSSAPSLDVLAGGSATIAVNADAADETPVYWFTSNGRISPDSGSLSSGQAMATLSTTGGRIGKTVVTATVGDRMFIWEGNFTSSAPVQVSFENPFLLGGIQAGGDPPQDGNGEDYEGPWFIHTKGVIRAPGFGGSPATVTVTNGSSLVHVTGLDGNQQITLDQHGYAEFEVASAGTPNQFGRVNIQVQVNPQGAEYVEIVETTPWTHVGDFFGGLIGMDTSTETGVVTSIVGGYVIIGDVGAIVKNAVRNAGWSDKEPNNFELAMAGAGLLATFSGPGDGIVSAIRIIIQRIGNSPLTDVLWRIAKNIISHGKLPSAAEQGFITLMKNDEVFSQAAKHVLTDDKLFAQAARGIEKLGDPFANAVKNAATTNSIGTVTARNIVDAVGQLSDDVLAGLKNSGKLDDALAGITRIMDKAVADPKLLGKLLENPNAFSAVYKQADLLQDAKRLFDGSPNAKGLEKLLSEVADQSDQLLGRTMEFVAAAEVGAAGKLVTVTGRLDNFDKSYVDLVATDSIIQVKTTYQAIRRDALNKVNPSTLANPDRVKIYLSTIKQIAREATSTELPYKIIVQKGQLANFPPEVMEFAQEAGIVITETLKAVK